MTQVYSNPKRESEPTSLPDIEVFYHDSFQNESGTCWEIEEGTFLPDGWYWWSCFPGCIPDDDPQGPFDTEEEATKDAQEDSYDEESDYQSGPEDFAE